MPKLLFARAPHDDKEERQIRKLVGRRHAPGDWMVRARMIVRSWEEKRTTVIARDLGCHPQTVRERIARFNAEGIDGLGDRPGVGRKPRLTEEERGKLLEAIDAANPTGELYLINDNLSSHSSGPVQEWLADHPRIRQDPVPTRACWLNLIQGW